MVSNQIEFDNKYSKTIKVIRIRDENNFQGQLIVESYSNLEKLYLRDVKNVDKIVLKDLIQLQECTILNCNATELIIENCPQIKNLNIENNSLTNLEFLKDLTNLEELKFDGSKDLIKFLEPYEGDWKEYQKDLQNSTDQNTLGLLIDIRALKKELSFSEQKYAKLKEFLKEKVFILLSTQAKQDLVNELNKKLQQGKKDLLALGMTEELMSNTEAIIESVKDLKEELESELTLSKGKIKELEKELAKLKEESQGKAKILERKKEELARLKETIISDNKSVKRLNSKLDDLLEKQDRIIKNENDKKLKERFEDSKEELAEKISENEVNQLCQLQAQITQLEIALGKITQTINNYYGKYSGLINQGNIGAIGDNSQGIINQFQSEEQLEAAQLNLRHKS
ncbi:MAG: Chromosome partition protein Smc [Mycoplasmataceae bacterium]|nr:MAG: Chromosome partition protein Smc [Mycoplasmataceae bacterium]